MDSEEIFTEAALARAEETSTSPDDVPFVGPHDMPHTTSHQVVRDILRGRLTKPALDQLRGAIDSADKPATAKQKSDHAVGRALR
jgi:hypothetical protein